MTRRLDDGTRGEVTLTELEQDERGRWVTAQKQNKPGGRVPMWRARLVYRTHSGQVKDISARLVGHRRKIDVEREAEQKLDAKWKQRTRDELGASHVDDDTPLGTLGQEWLDRATGHGSKLAQSTQTLYARMYHAHVEDSDLARLTLARANDVRTLTTWLQVLADEHGTGTAKTVRSMLAGVLDMAVQQGLLPLSALRNVPPITGTSRAKRKNGEPRDTTRALTPTERDRLLNVADEYAARAHLYDRSTVKWKTAADLLAVMAGTGTRISEARNLRWEDVDLEGEGGEVHVKGTKSSSADRMVALPDWLTERLTARREQQDPKSAFVFPAPANPENVWDKSNSAGAVRLLLDKAGLTWATPHTLRRTAATRMHEAGVPVHHVADVLGHSDPSMTARTYLGRSKEANRAAASAL